MTRLALAAALLLAAAPAFAQNWTTDQIGRSTYYNGSNGWHGTSDQIGNSTYSTFTGPNGQMRNCTSDRIGSSVYTSCY